MKTNQPETITRALSQGRKVLWVGCAFILVVMSVSTADIIYSLRRTAAKSDAEISAFRERGHSLDTLRGIMLRSALSPESDTGRAIATGDLPAAREQAMHILEQFTKSIDGSGDQATQKRLADLRSSIDQFWKALPGYREENLQHPHESSPLDRTPERIQIRLIARQILELNTQQQDYAEAQVHLQHQHLERELVISSSLSVLVVLACSLQSRIV